MKKIIIVALITIAIFSSGCLESIHANEGYTDTVIEKKFIDVSKEGSHYLLVTGKGTFEVDRPLLDTFNQSRNPDTVYSKIIEGKKYRLHHYGYRIDWLYEYPIVVDATKIEL
ncbi:MAG: hypothetical protein OIN66_04150 [Candidatus Methanoperedens sp.]|nr:hypothetical protein [Candidatus Methanoperedens sp.]